MANQQNPQGGGPQHQHGGRHNRNRGNWQNRGGGQQHGQQGGQQRPCGKCGFFNPSSAKFCTQCGHKFTCPHCNQLVPVLTPPPKFCPSCGKELPAPSATGTASTPTPANNERCPNCRRQKIAGKRFCTQCRAAYEPVKRLCNDPSGCNEVMAVDANTCQKGHPVTLAIEGHPWIICNACGPDADPTKNEIDHVLGKKFGFPDVFETPVGVKDAYHGGAENRRKFHEGYDDGNGNWIEGFCVGSFDSDDMQPMLFGEGQLIRFMNNYCSCGKCGQKSWRLAGTLDNLAKGVKDLEPKIKQAVEVGKTIFSTLNNLRKKMDAFGKPSK